MFKARRVASYSYFLGRDRWAGQWAGNARAKNRFLTNCFVDERNGKGFLGANCSFAAQLALKPGARQTVRESEFDKIVVP
jgi:hypothetical protein